MRRSNVSPSRVQAGSQRGPVGCVDGHALAHEAVAAPVRRGSRDPNAAAYMFGQLAEPVEPEEPVEGVVVEFVLVDGVVVVLLDEPVAAFAIAVPPPMRAPVTARVARAL